MKILFVNNIIRGNRPPFNFPLGLGILAAIMRDKGYEVHVYDHNALRTPPEDMFRVIRKLKEIDIVATGGLITTYDRLKKVVPGLRDVFPRAKIIIGGGVTVEPEIIFKNIPAVDFCVHGEGEHTFLELCKALGRNETDFSDIRGISYLRNGDLTTTQPAEFILDLDKLPMPAYDLFPAEIYFRNNVIKNQMRIRVDTKRCATLMWSRGCPYKCSFCWRMTGPVVRYRSLNLLMEEIDYLRLKYDVDSYLFVDECINAKRTKAKEFATRLVESGNAAPWYSHARVNTFDEEMARLFKKSGCVGLNFGIESASTKMLDIMNKKLKPKQAAVAVRFAQKAKLNPVCTFIVGMPGETRSTLKDTALWIIKNMVQKSVFFFATPYPGCDLYNMPLVQKLISEKYGTKDSFFSALGDAADFTLNMTDFSDAQLVALKRRAERVASLLYLENWTSLLLEPKRIGSALRDFLR